ncbi:TonB-dependent receptor [Imperialibacter roseus]|uniref:TonB-dependent receptor n=1 Tax=Imperialibacter roseus TaxID=1324217 RepID=A0ABZ0IQJ4_9BACT|nr:TonB-dependent receptor [Imperialibacter roseus]WOK07323.1 TonB-dependent receptor [Imperialibacter roseus]
MKTIFTGALCLLLALTAFGQAKQFTISGYLKDESNGEALIGANVFVREISGGTTANVYGFYSITLAEGTYNLDVSYVGYGDTHKVIDLTQDIRLDLELRSADAELETVVITSEAIDENVASIEMSTIELEMKAIEKLPAFAGEVDVLKSIQLLPGVSSVGEGTAGFNVRGGSVGQNLVLLDEAPVYQSSHLFGFFSVFNPDAVKDVKLYKGGIPTRYGGRLSSILDIRMKEGNNKDYDVAGGVGTVFSRLAVEGPIKKDKSSFIIAGRRSYADVLVRPFTNMLSDGAGMYFYDLTAKTNFNINDINRVYVSGYLGRDVFSFDESQGFDWGNRTATVRWNHLYGNKLFSNFSAFYSNYDYGFSFGTNKLDKFDWAAEVSTWNFKPEFNWFLNVNNELTFGGEAILYGFEPANASTVNNGIRTDISLDRRKALETAVYLSNDQKLSDKLFAQYGVRFSYFNNLGGSLMTYGDTLAGVEKPLLAVTEKGDWESIASYQNVEPRASLRYQLSELSSVKASYNRMSQYIHQISNTTASTPIDIWQPSDNNIAPQMGNQVAMGYFRNIGGKRFETSAEVYYKWNKNQVDYIDGAELFINEFIASQLLSGVGRAYGLELYVKKNAGRLTGWVSYTLGKSELKVDGINFGNDRKNHEGNWYATRFDQRHNLKVAGFYDLTKRVSLSANFSFMSGTPTTFPTDRYMSAGYVIPYVSGSERNNFRLPNYHRLDASLTINNVWRGKKNRSGNDHIVFSVYNLYARKNPFSIYFSQGRDRQMTDAPQQTAAKQLSLIGTLIPAVTYNFKF